VTTLTPSKRQFVAPQQVTTEAAIHASWAGDFYLVMAEGGAANSPTVGVRVYFHPLVRFIWIGALIMFVGGLFSLTDRRLRVGAPSRKAMASGGSRPMRQAP
jgi:cytochrome c-type biogenesis protein CcmF